MLKKVSRVSHWAFGAKMTSYQRRCDVITSNRREYDVILRHVPAGILQKGEALISSIQYLQYVQNNSQSNKCVI